jgi:two-component system LytT family response regulator
MKLKTVIIDDDPLISVIIKDLCKDSNLVQITHTYNDPIKFLEATKEIDYDLCLLDIEMPGMDGLKLAQMLGDKAIIFITGKYNILKDVLSAPHMDVVVKPIVPDLLHKAFDKTYKCIGGREVQKTHGSFRVAEAKEKVSICLSDILMVKSDETDPRNKYVILKGGECYTLMECTFDKLLDCAPLLVKVNRTHLVSMGAVQRYKYNLISVKGIRPDKAVVQITLSDLCRKNFMKKMTAF